MALRNTKKPIKWSTFLLCSIISLGQFVAAYQSVIIGTTLQKRNFMIQMGLWDQKGNPTPNSRALEGAVVGLFQAGAVIGTILVAFVVDRWGRKAGLLFASFFSTVGLAGLAGSMNVKEFLVFRFIAGVGTWAYATSAATYIPELAPSEYRGFFAGLNGIMIGLGCAVASYIGMGFYFVHNAAAQWRAPLAIPLFAPLAILCSMPLLPESPRFRLLQDKVEEAREIFYKLHATPGVDSSLNTLLEQEFNQMKQQAAHDRLMDSSWSVLFTRSTYLKRVYIGCMLTVLGQSTGVFVINNYGQTFYEALGYSASSRQILQGNRDILALIGNLAGSWIVDRVGRRPTLLVSFVGCFFCILLEGITVKLFANSDNASGKNAGVAFLYIFLIFYATGIDVCIYVIIGEIFPNHLRVKGVSLSLAALNMAGTIYLSITDTAFASIGWKLFLVFAVITFVGIFWIYFTIPETRQLPLEEIDALFANDQEVMVFTSDYGQEADREEKRATTTEHIEN